MMNYNFLETRLSHLIPITSELTSSNVTITYSPISVGKLRLILHIEAAMKGLRGLGFGDKDVDEVKSILADTNLYLLAGTVFVASVHVSLINKLLFVFNLFRAIFRIEINFLFY